MSEPALCRPLRDLDPTNEPETTKQIGREAADLIGVLYAALDALAREVATTSMPEAACDRLLPYAMNAAAVLKQARGVQ